MATHTPITVWEARPWREVGAWADTVVRIHTEDREASKA